MALVACCFGLLAAFAFITAIIAVKREAPTPMVLRVDDATGAVDMLTTIERSEKTYGEIVDIYWLNSYVLNRESYDYNSIQMLYNTTALLVLMKFSRNITQFLKDRMLAIRFCKIILELL